MRFSLALLAQVAVATATSSYTSDAPICTTYYGPNRPRSVGTTTLRSTTTNSQTNVVITTPSVTVTPAPSTTTFGAVTTLTFEADIVPSTDTYTSTSTTTTTSTSTSVTVTVLTSSTTVTTTTSTTTTIATQAGFTPIASEAGYAPRRRRAAETPPPQLKARAAANAYFPTRGQQSPNWPAQTVTCNVLVHTTTTLISTSTAATSTSTAPTPLVSTTTTQTQSTTTTVTVADATVLTSTTVTASAFTVTTSTSTTSTTVSNTVYLPVATYYAQCAANNIINSRSGLQIGEIAYVPGFSMAAATVSDGPHQVGYGCCAKCAMTPTCAGYGQYPGGQCYYILTQGQCDGSQTYGDSYHYFGTPGQFTYTVGNGQCGALGAVYGA